MILNRSPRREFLGTSLAMAASLPARSSGGQSTDSSSPLADRISFSLKWNMVRIEGTVVERFQALKDIGFDGVELDSPGEISVAQACEARDHSDLPIEGIVNSTHWQVRHSDPNPAIRAQARRNLAEALRYAKAVGADSVLLVPGKVTDPQHENHDQVWQRSLADLRQLLPLAERLEIRILIENVGNGFCERPELFAQYLDEIDSPWVAAHFDIGNHIRVSPPADWIRILGPRIEKLDVKDRTRANEKTLIGEGDADWPAVRQALLDIDYRGWAAAEVSGGDRERLADVLARMQRVLRGAG